MIHIGANIEPSSTYVSQTDAFLNTYGIRICGNDYNSNPAITALNTNAIRNSFQPPPSRPVFVIINCVSNSTSHLQYQCLVNHNGTGVSDFNAVMGTWRNIIDAVQAPRPQITGARLSGGAFEFTFPGQRGRTNRVEYTTDFLNWTTATNVFGTNAPILYRDPGVSGSERRIYRIVRP